MVGALIVLFFVVVIGSFPATWLLMLFLGKLKKEGSEGLPTGFQHFASNTEETYFRHLTSEYIKTVEENGAQKRNFAQRGPNHWLDCFVYGYALTHFAGLWAWGEEQWDARARELTAMTRPDQQDMFGAPGTTIAAAIPMPASDESESPAQPVGTRTKSDGLDALSQLNR